MTMSAGSYAQAAQIGYNMAASYQKAKAEKAIARYKAQVAKNNAQVAEWQAQQEERIGAFEEQNSRLRTADLYGTQRAVMAANGLDLGEGVATDILATSKYMGERDALTIRDNASRKAWAARVQKTNFLNESAFSTATANAINPFMSSIGSLLGNAGAVADIYKDWKGT